MAILYLTAGCAVILINIRRLPQAVGGIISEAFSIRSAIGGTAAYGMARALRTGVSMGVFSNEAGLGTSVIVHCDADVKEPVEQGMWGIFEVFADTLVCCTVTALAILTSGVWAPFLRVQRHRPMRRRLCHSIRCCRRKIHCHFNCIIRFCHAHRLVILWGKSCFLPIGRPSCSPL